MKISELQQGTPAWHIWRNLGIGGSDAPAITGESPYRTPLQLYREKIGETVLADEDANDFIFSKGHQTEGLVRKQFQDLTGVEMKPLCVIHPEFDYLRASLDGFDSKLGILEAKLVGQEVLANARKGEIPAHHMTQIQHQLVVADVDRAQWFGHDGKKGGVLVEVKRNKKFINQLLDMEHVFWNLIQARQAPALSPRDYLIPEDLALLVELRTAKKSIEAAQKKYESLKEQIVNTYNHERIGGAGVKLFKVERSGSINYKELPAVKRLSAKYLEKFRGKGSVSWTISLEKEESA